MIKKRFLCTEDVISELTNELREHLGLNKIQTSIANQYISQGVLWGLSQSKIPYDSTGLAMTDDFGETVKTFVTMDDAVNYLYNSKITNAQRNTVRNMIYAVIKSRRHKAYGYSWKLLKKSIN